MNDIGESVQQVDSLIAGFETFEILAKVGVSHFVIFYRIL